MIFISFFGQVVLARMKTVTTPGKALTIQEFIGKNQNKSIHRLT